jgi:prepilin-type N-terminal cleavage/methylation domain-containing protein
VKKLSVGSGQLSASERGVTLIEMLIVVTLIAIMVGIAFPAVGAGVDSLRMTSAADGVAAFLQTAVNRTERHQQMMELSISRTDNAMVVQSPEFERRYKLPEGVAIAEILPAEPIDPNLPRRYLLYPGGAPPRIAVRLVNQRGAERIVSLDPVTGIPQIERVVPK